MYLHASTLVNFELAFVDRRAQLGVDLASIALSFGVTPSDALATPRTIHHDARDSLGVINVLSWKVDTQTVGSDLELARGIAKVLRNCWEKWRGRTTKTRTTKPRTETTRTMVSAESLLKPAISIACERS